MKKVKYWNNIFCISLNNSFCVVTVAVIYFQIFGDFEKLNICNRLSSRWCKIKGLNRKALYWYHCLAKWWKIRKREFLNMPVFLHNRLDNFHCQLFTDRIFPDGRTMNWSFPITSVTEHCSMAVKEPSPCIVSNIPSLLIIRCSRYFPLYLKSTTSIGRSSSFIQGYSMTLSCLLRNKGNIEYPFSRNWTECPVAISVSIQEKNWSLGICFISQLEK